MYKPSKTEIKKELKRAKKRKKLKNIDSNFIFEKGSSTASNKITFFGKIRSKFKKLLIFIANKL